MNQKGFIPIIFIIIIGAVAATSATFSVVKYKDGITANVSKVFNNIIDVPDTESTGEIKEPGLSEESIIKETSETKEKQDDAQKLREQLRIAEKKQLEVEKQLVEERARQAAEKIQAEQEAQRLVEEQKKQEESILAAQQLKIEKCKAEAQSVVDKFLAEINKMYLEAQKTLQNWEQAIVNARKNHATCELQSFADKEFIGAPYELKKEIANSSCGYYLTEEARLKSDLSQKTIAINNFFQGAEKTGQTEYSRIYLECLNK